MSRVVNKKREISDGCEGIGEQEMEELVPE